MMTFEEMINKLLDNDIEITLRRNDGVVWYDLNTGMKSHLLVAKSGAIGDSTILTKGRYDTGYIDTWGDLMRAVKDCLCGNQYMHYAWRDLLVKEGYLKAKTTTVYEYE